MHALERARALRAWRRAIATKAEQIESILDRAHGVRVRRSYSLQPPHRRHARRRGSRRFTTALDDEKRTVAPIAQTLGGYTDESADVGGGIMAESLKAVTQRFYNVVVRADVGIIDVAWALKDDSTHRRRTASSPSASASSSSSTTSSKKS